MIGSLETPAYVVGYSMHEVAMCSIIVEQNNAYQMASKYNKTNSAYSAYEGRMHLAAKDVM